MKWFGSAFPRHSCAYSGCSFHFESPDYDPKAVRLVRKGVYFRKSDSRRIRRFECQSCRRSFSSATGKPEFGHKKRHLHSTIEKLFCSGVSQRRIARLLGVSRTTVERKFVFLGMRARLRFQTFREEYVAENGPIFDLRFDEMESFERSKCLPVSIPLVVEARSRKILALAAGSMPAKGPLARISVRKYGKRDDHRPQMAHQLWSELRSFLVERPRIRSDQNPKYPGWIRPHCPEAIHETVKGRRGCVVGQGELKRGGFDPLFDLNHTAAMIRANVNRLFRRTWCTSKRADRLELHLYLYADYHNRVLTA